ncbi:ATP-binding protein [Nocardioides terrisoli]|uniref:ATP-binding protein n=1 Tax=Nocardioides terrisoli TaxID=3388267 RepID=UPI00287B96DE|nr:PspC domain-containing protein [Nocardioides marmorisolisilvae]
METTARRTVPGTAPRGASAPVRRAYRRTDEGMLGGVAAGLAVHLGVPVQWVRIAFLVAAVFGGFGVLVYAGLWMLLREQPHFEDAAPGLAAAARQGKRPRRVRRLVDYGPMVAMGAIALGALALVSALTGRAFVIWPAMLAVAGVAVLWRQADEAQRERWLDSGRISPLAALVGGGGWGAWLRVVAGTLLLVAAIVTFSLRSGDWNAALNVGIAALLGILGLAFIVGPWLLRLTNDLSEERAERVRSQERADVAAHLHDSVLQTLAMIQKSAEDPATVARLARAQERDLRSWLYDAPDGGETTLVAALRQAAAEIEDGTGVPVEVVSVGDRPLPESARPVVLAAREAMLNAAKHSGAGKVDVYAEVAATGIEVFVRDRGHGFELADVAPDRHGVRNSIIDRMQRHGGVAEVRSNPGAGTEIRLSMPWDEPSKESGT